MCPSFSCLLQTTPKQRDLSAAAGRCVEARGRSDRENVSRTLDFLMLCAQLVLIKQTLKTIETFTIPQILFVASRTCKSTSLLLVNLQVLTSS